VLVFYNDFQYVYSTLPMCTVTDLSRCKSVGVVHNCVLSLSGVYPSYHGITYHIISHHIINDLIGVLSNEYKILVVWCTLYNGSLVIF